VFCKESYNVFPIWLSFITKLNSNQLNIKKKIDKDNFEKKNITKKENTKETGKKPHGKKTMAIHSNLQGKLQYFSHIL